MRKLMVAATVLLALVALGCSGDDDDAAPTTTTLPVAGPTTTVPGPDGLASLLVSDAPEGFEVQPDGDGGSGYSDLARAIADDGAADAESVLTSMGFKQGYRRVWTKGDDLVIGLFVYEFKAQGGALAYNFRTLEDYKKPPYTPLSVPAVPQANGAHAESSDGFGSIIQFPKAAFMVQVNVVAPDQAQADQLALELADKQFQALPG